MVAQAVIHTCASEREIAGLRPAGANRTGPCEIKEVRKVKAETQVSQN